MNQKQREIIVNRDMESSSIKLCINVALNISIEQKIMDRDKEAVKDQN